MTALSMLGSAFLLCGCDNGADNAPAVNEDTLMTERSEDLEIVMSENGRKSYFFKTPLLEGYMLARDPYREFRKGIDITTYQDDSMTTVNAHLTSNYAIYYENRKLWEAKGDVVVVKTDGTRLYTQQLFWNSMTKRIYSNVDTKIVKGTDEAFGEGFESDEDLKQWQFRRMSGKMLVNVEPSDDDEETTGEGDETADGASEAGEGDSAATATSGSAKTEPAKPAPPKTERPTPALPPVGTDDSDRPVTVRLSGDDGGDSIVRQSMMRRNDARRRGFAPLRDNGAGNGTDAGGKAADENRQ